MRKHQIFILIPRGSQFEIRNLDRIWVGRVEEERKENQEKGDHPQA
jgi:hypothetical protein